MKASMSRAVSLSLPALALVATASAAQAAVSIPVNNGSFETPVVAPGAFTFGPGGSGGNAASPNIPGFGTGTDVGIHRLGDFGAPAVGKGNTDGAQLLFLGNGANFTNIFQDISNAQIGDPSISSYTLTVAFATRSAVGQETNGTINLGIQDRQGTIGLTPVTTPVPRNTLGNDTFRDFSVSLPATGVASGDTIRLFVDKLAGNSLIVADNFRLTANQVPEPASLGLIVAALGLGGSRRRRRVAR